VPAPQWPIHTERLLLRPFEPGDLEALHAIHSDPGVVRYLRQAARPMEEVRELLKRRVRGEALDHEGDGLAAAVILPGTGALIGDVSLHWASRVDRQGELGFVFHPTFHRRGYATEAARPILDFAFGELGLHRVSATAEERNLASIRVLEKLGMRREGHMIENEWIKGEWQSEVLYAILDREWSG
jgi:RimJ/RimL family protein N-acetyltransferase